MKVTRTAGIQCVIVLMVLFAEIAFSGRYHTVSDTDRDTGARGEEADKQAREAILSEYSVYCLNEKDGIFLLSEKREGDGKSLVWQNGNAAGPLQILEGKAVVCSDINFDGYPDIEVYDGEKKESSYFLWDEAKSQFVRAVIPADEAEGISIEKKLDEFKTFWGHGDVRDEGDRLLKSTEKLYRWDDIELKEVRSISCRFEGEEIVITLTDAESGKCLGGGTFAVKGWETNPEVRELYARFYQGYAPKELYYMRHDAPGEEQVIPESLVIELRRANEEEGTETELLESLRTGRELSDGEKKAEAIKSADIARTMEDTDSGYVKMIRVDLDNDGVEDIFAEADFGGSGPFGEYILYRGNEAGEYKRTGLGTEEYVRKPFYVICFEGKNYVCHHKTESGKIWNGLILEGYRDGELVETVSLDQVPGMQTDSVIFCRDGYRDMARKELEKAPEIYDQRMKYIASEGDAEQRVEEGTNIFVSDIDNDGTTEKYIKHIIDHPTDFFGLEMEAKAGKTEAEPAIPDCRDEAGAQIMMWVDACDGKNIMNVIYRTGLYDYMVEGFLLDDAGGCSDLYAIERKTEPEVETVRIWELPGKRKRIP